MNILLAALLVSIPTSTQTPIDASNPGASLRLNPSGSALLGATTGVGSASDDFNRPDSSVMGPDWTEQSGDLNISNNAGYGTSLVSWMTHNSLNADYKDSVHQIDFFPMDVGTGTIFVALTVGSATVTSENVFAKVQDNNSDGLYDRVWFYKGINGNAWGTGNSAALATPTASGRMQLSFSPDGDIAILDIDRDFDGNWDEQFQMPGILTAFGSVGTDYGISTFNDPSFDNWNVNGGAPGIAYCAANTMAGCPCGNNVSEESGCLNSGGSGAILTGVGDASVGADTLVLSVTQAPAVTPGLFFSGPNAPAASFFGDGLLCVGGPIIRLGVVFTDSSGNAQTNFSISTVEALTGGELRNYQYWFRDTTGPCGAGFNTSNGYSVQW